MALVRACRSASCARYTVRRGDGSSGSFGVFALARRGRVVVLVAGPHFFARTALAQLELPASRRPNGCKVKESSSSVIS